MDQQYMSEVINKVTTILEKIDPYDPSGAREADLILRDVKQLATKEKESYDISGIDPEVVKSLVKKLHSKGFGTYISSGKLAIQKNRTTQKASVVLERFLSAAISEDKLREIMLKIHKGQKP